MKFTFPFAVLAVLLSSCTSNSPLPLDADHAKVILLTDDATKKDARDALTVATKYLEHWRDGEIDKALTFVDRRLRDVFEKEMARKQDTKDIERVTEIRVFRTGRSNALVARVGVVRKGRPGGMILDMEFMDKTWVITAK